MASRRASHTGRGYTSRHPSGCRVSVSRPSHCAVNTSRCRVGTDTRPFPSIVSCDAPWNTVVWLGIVSDSGGQQSDLKIESGYSLTEPTVSHLFTTSGRL